MAPRAVDPFSLVEPLWIPARETGTDPIQPRARAQQFMSRLFSRPGPASNSLFARGTEKQKPILRARERHIENAHFLSQAFPPLPARSKPVRKTRVTLAGIRRFDLRANAINVVQQDRIGRVP